MVSTKTKQQRRAAGLCTYCKQPVAFGRALCLKHLITNKKAVNKQKIKRLAKGHCQDCGRPLPPDRQHLKSCYCQDRSYREDSIKDNLWN